MERAGATRSAEQTVASGAAVVARVGVSSRPDSPDTSFVSTTLAAIICIFTPGPGMLALFTTVATGGRREGVRFFAGEAEDVFWFALALVAIFGVSSIGSRISAWLGLCCGLYLIGWACEP